MKIELFSLLMCFFALSFGKSLPPYTSCEIQNGNEIRKLFVVTCDTRAHWKEFMAMKVWNITGSQLRDNGLHMINVCKGKNWGLHGFLTKPLLYYDYIKSLPSTSPRGGGVYVILMDSDTFWATSSIEKIWNKFDCARKGKNMVISSEMSCWIGRYCVQEDMTRWYSNPSISPSYSPFLNSGVVMGLATEVAKMLNYVIVNNASYFITYHKHKFDDQYAIADYAINIAPSEVQIDYHQQLAASCAVHAVGSPPDEGWPFVCKSTNGSFYNSCRDYTNLLTRKGHFRINDTSCFAYRDSKMEMPLYEEMSTIAHDPVIWHGNGAGKRTFLSLAHSSFHCFLKKYNMTEQDHQNTFGG